MSCLQKYSRLSSITLRKAPPTLPKDQRALLDWSQGLAMCNEKGQTKYKPDFFATIFLITTSGQVSRARRLEAAHHYQHHVPSSGSQISNMDHLIIFFSSQTATGFHAMRGYTVLFQEVLTILMNTPRFLAAFGIPKVVRNVLGTLLLKDQNLKFV